MASKRLLVVKYGGSVLEDGAAIRRAAEAIKEELDRGSRVVVVASAIKGVTDRLMEAAETISPDTPLDVVDHIIGLGEEQSVRLLASALKSLGADAIEVTPDSPSWPIFTDETYGDAEPIIEECRSGAELGLKPLIERGKVPVVCGFVGRSLDGNITTLGRGGSDTTAAILAHCLGADELVLVKDVGGIYSADPKKVGDAEPIEALSAREANLLSSTGAKILHDKVFRYKPDDLSIRIVSNRQALSGNGTLVKGTIPELAVEVHEDPVLKVTLVGDALSEPNSLIHIIDKVRALEGCILSMKGDRESLILYVAGSSAEVLGGVHEFVREAEGVKAVSAVEGEALISVRGRRLDDTAKSIEDVNDSLARKGIRLHGLMTGQSSVKVLVDWGRRWDASEILEKELGRPRNG